MTKPLKILKVCAIDATAWLQLRVQMEAMRDRGWDVHVACSDGPAMPKLRGLGLTTHVVPVARNTDMLSHLRSTIAMWRLMRAERFDVVHVHTPVASLIGRLAAKLAGVKAIMYTAHGFYFHDEMPPAQRRRHVALEAFFGRLMTHHLFTQSAEDAATAVREGIMPPGTVTNISNGVPLAKFKDVPAADLERWRAKLGLPAGKVVVGIVGRVVEEKGFREFFTAAQTVAATRPDVVFLVVGSKFHGDRDTFVEEVERLATSPVLDGRVYFSGFSDEIPALMGLMDVFVLPSYREGMPRTIIEAMASSRPVVATNIRGSREEVVEGETGFLVPTKDAEQLAERIGRLVDDPELRRRLGAAGRERAETHFDERMVCNTLLNAIEQVADARLPARR